MKPQERKRVAIVGTGISSLTCAHVLSRRHEVTLFDGADYIGGHTNTHDIDWKGQKLALDTGFIVFNDWTYPNFLKLLSQLGVKAQPSDMSFSVRCERTGLEYNGTSFNSIFAQRSNLLRWSFWRMLREIVRFNREAPAILERPDDQTKLSDFLREGRYSREFVDNYLVPMGAAIWSASPEQMQGFPARYFVQFFANHGFLSVDDRPTWRVVEGGSRTYAEKLVRPFADRVHLSSPVEAVTRLDGGGVEVKVRGRDPERFDAVVLGCHSDQALGVLSDASDAERAVLGAIPYQENEATLHTDARLLPKRRLAWASWNYHLPKVGTPRVSVSYWMNMLQSLESSQGLADGTQFLVTLNRSEDVDPSKILKRITYHHPTYTPEGVAAQARHAEISGVRDTYFCGAYWRYGFHEDGVVSGLAVCRQFGMDL
jgi:predicted NAD/FAD-binding protein